MADRLDATAKLLADVPLDQRERIVSGMRWTVWLSAISLPFSYGTTILLARTGPEALGTYGLLSVYIGVVLSLFYLGGDPVAIKYFPELSPEKRLSFLGSYFLIICLATVPWLAAAAIWPGKLHYLLGENASPSFQLFIIFLAPLSILTSLVGAALKGMLEIRFAQVIARLVMIGSFVVYAVLYLAFPKVLLVSYTEVIWGTYLGFCTIGAVLGLRRLLHLQGLGGKWRSLRFYLPPGFWHYTLSLQQLSALGFFTQRLDAILILNFGNLGLLGQYVAILTLAETIRLISRFFLDTLLPSLTNMVAVRNWAAAADVFHTHMRILFLVAAASTSGLILLARPITALLGARYAGLNMLIVLLALCVGLSTPSAVGGTLLSSIGKQQRGVWIVLAQIALYVTLFALLWERYQLLGAVVAYGAAWIVANGVLLLVGKLSTPFPVIVGRDYAVFTLIALSSSAIAKWVPLGFTSSLAAWVVSLAAFLLMAGYSIEECKRLIECFSPFGRLSFRRSA